MLVIASVGIALQLSRRWMREERFSYPLIRFPVELVCPSLWRNRWFWTALLLIGSTEIVNGLNFLYPSVPSLKFKWTWAVILSVNRGALLGGCRCGFIRLSPLLLALRPPI